MSPVPPCGMVTEMCSVEPSTMDVVSSVDGFFYFSLVFLMLTYHPLFQVEGLHNGIFKVTLDRYRVADGIIFRSYDFSFVLYCYPLV